MAKATETSGNVATGTNSTERTQKAAATRRVTAEKRSRLGDRERFAHDKIMACRRSLDKLADSVLDGGGVSPSLLAAIADVDREIGNSMFA